MADQSLSSPKKSYLLLKILGILLIILITCAAGLWIWSGSNGSLAQGLSWAQRFLQPGQSLSATDVQGSLRHGGRIGQLQWHQEGMDVKLTGIDLNWQLLGALTSNKLTINSLTIDQIQIIQQNATPEESTTPPPSTSTGKGTPPEKITLPIHIDLKNLQVNRVIMGEDTQKVVASDLALSYQFDGTQHSLKLDRAHVADGDYQGQLTLLAQNPQLNAQFTGALKAKVPESNQSVNLNADVKISGPLTQLQVNANAQASTAQSNASTAPKAQLHAVVSPWNALMVPEADLALQAFNAKAFWPQAPQCLLSGTATITTAKDGASGADSALIVVNIKNSAAGALDHDKLPVTALTVKALAQGRSIRIDQLDATTGQGNVHVTGNLHLPAAGARAQAVTWQATSQLNNVDPRFLYSQVAHDKISGTVVASQKTAQSIAFDAKLRMANAANIAQFRIQQLNAQGDFVIGKQIQVHALNVQSNDGARVQGSVTYALASQAASGPLKLSAPGLDASVALTGFAPHAGTAHIQLNINNINAALKWLRPRTNHMDVLLNFLEQAQKHTQQLANYTKAMPIDVEGGWKTPHVKVQVDLDSLLTQIIKDAAKQGVLSQLGLGGLPAPGAKPDGTQKPATSREARKELLNQLGQELLNRHKK